MKLVFGVLFILSVATFASAEILSVKQNFVEITNSSKPYIAQVILVVPRHYPLKVVQKDGKNYKVRDFMGREGWVDKAAIGAGRTVVVKVGRVNIRTGPGTEHDLMFRANRGVVFKVLERKDDWVKVEHESKQVGWIARSLVWGNG